MKKCGMVRNKLSVGNAEILVLHDKESALLLSMIFPKVVPESWAPYQERYPEEFNSSGHKAGQFCWTLARVVMCPIQVASQLSAADWTAIFTLNYSRLV